MQNEYYQPINTDNQQRNKTREADKGPYFEPVNLGGDTFEVPESISDAPALIETSTEAIDTPGLDIGQGLQSAGRVLTAVLILITGWASWQLGEILMALSEIHWGLSALLGVGVVSLMVIALRPLLRWRHRQKDWQEIAWLQKEAGHLRQLRDYQQTSQWLERFQKIYQNSPYQQELSASLEQVQSYQDASEVIEHLDRSLMQPLDQKCQAVIARYSGRNGILVATSPLAIADMLITLYNTSKMIDEIGAIYGLKLSWLGKARLARQVVAQLALAGGSEMLIDTLSDMTSQGMTARLSSRAAQGMGVGLYSIRIGLLVARMVRPIPYPAGHSPSYKAILKKVRQQIWQQLGLNQ